MWLLAINKIINECLSYLEFVHECPCDAIEPKEHHITPPTLKKLFNGVNINVE